jgi:CHASE2 domain-containing sensor protein
MKYFRYFLRSFFSKDNFFILLFMGILGIAITNIPVNIDILNPVQDAFGDFDITDVYFSKIRKIEATADQRITVINLGDFRGEMSRRTSIEQLLVINKYKPKVVGIDAFYNAPLATQAKDSMQAIMYAQIDTVFAETLQKTPNLVMVTKVDFKMNSPELKKEIPKVDTLITSYPYFVKNVEGGFANLITEGTRENYLIDEKAGGLSTVRTFSPTEKIGNEQQLAFAVKIANKYAPEKTKKFLERKNKVEYIYYRGNFQQFRTIEWNQLMEMDEAKAEKELKEILEGRIVLMGFLGSSLNVKSLEDKFYTPYIGRSEYDMYGILVHANIISMILDEDYINEMPSWANYLISFLIAYLTIVLFVYLYKSVGFWYDGLSIILQFLLSLIILFVIIAIFDKYSMRVDWTQGFLAIVLGPNLLEIYFGVVKKVYDKAQRARNNRDKPTFTLDNEIS